MQVTGKIVVVTGGAKGIGRALCDVFHRAGAAKVVVADIDPAGARAVAAKVDGAAFKCDVGKETDIRHVVEETERQFGPIALFCSNAGIGGGFDPLADNAGGTSDEPWSRSWAVHVMAHVYAARHLVPRMKARGEGYFLNTISAAGLLSQIGSPAYSTTKHAAVGFAESLAISHKSQTMPCRESSRKHLPFCRTRKCSATCARRRKITIAGYPAWPRSRPGCARITGSEETISVIASEAKQSIARQTGLLRRFRSSQ